MGAGDFGQHMGAYGIGCPPGPGNFEVAQEGASLVLSWSPPPAEVIVDHYVVYRDTMWMYTVPIAIVSAAETTFVDITIPPCVPHDYCIAAVDTNGLEGALTAEVAAELCYGGPTDLIAAFDVDGNELAWNPAEGAVEYQVIMRSSGPTPPDSIGWVPPSVTTFLDEATADCVRDNYTYEILPVYDTAWRGLPSVAAMVDPAPSRPSGLVASWSGDDVVLGWAPNCESDFRRYWVYRDTIPFPMPLNSDLLVGVTADTTFVDAGLDPERVYFYRLTASDFSAQKSRYSDLAYLGEGEVLTVPSPYGSIQEALNAASALDTVVVGPGTYDENVTLKDAVTLVGLEGAEATTIRGGSGAVVTAGVLVELTVLKGFTVDGLGTANLGLDSWGSSLRVEDCVFRNASVGASFRFGGSARLSANVFAIASTTRTTS